VTAPSIVENTASNADTFPAMLTWAGDSIAMLESARVQVSSRAIKVHGRIVAGRTKTFESFSVSYDLLLDETGVTRRLSMRSTVARGDRQVSLSRNSEGLWLVDHGQGPRSADFGGATDVDVVLSSLFATLPVRRLRLHEEHRDEALPVVAVTLPELTVQLATYEYSSSPTGVEVRSPTGSALIALDEDGFALDYAGITHRI
jgi:hypothetical protein